MQEAYQALRLPSPFTPHICITRRADKAHRSYHLRQMHVTVGGSNTERTGDNSSPAQLTPKL